MSIRTSIHRRTLAFFLVAGIGASLVACAPPDPEPTPTPPPTSAAPTPTPTADSLSAPAPLIDVPCAELVSAATLTSAFTTPVTAIDPAESLMGAYPTIAPTYAVRSLGGLTCEWNNGQPQSFTGGSSATYVGVRVIVLPNATSQWDRFIDYYGAEAEGDYCASGGPTFYCSTDALVGSTWVEVIMFGAVSDVEASALGAEVVAGITAAGPGAELWAPPAGTAALPADCPGVVSDAAVQAALGLDVPIQAASGGGGWSIEAGARENWGGPGCFWAFLDADAGVGSLATLPGGAWAWDEAREFITLPAIPESVGIAGLAAGDEAWLRCAAGDDYCLIDLVIGGNWVEAYVWPDDVGGAVPMDRRAGALAIGAAIVAAIG